MPLRMILGRAWQKRGVLLVLLVGLCLTTGFMALSPLYVRAVSEAALRYEIARSQPGDFDFVINSLNERISLDELPTLQDELGSLVTTVEQVTRSDGIFCGDAILPSQPMCFELYAYVAAGFSRLEDRFRLLEGRYPAKLDAPNANGARLEAVITASTAERGRRARRGTLGIGTLTMLGSTREGALTVEVVGLVEPVDRAHDFWRPLGIVTDGQFIDVTENFQRFDYGLIIPEDSYDEVIAPVTPFDDRYQWYVSVDTNELQQRSMDNLAVSLNTIEAVLRAKYEQLTLSGNLPAMLSQFVADVAAAEAPVALLSFCVLILLAYQLMTTTALILERDTAEWAAIASRGGSMVQFLKLQAVTVSALALLAALLGIPVALLMLGLLGRFGVTAQVLDGASVNLIPRTSILLSAAASIVIGLILIAPIWFAARRGVLSLKQSVSRPPTRPAWARYFVDLILIALGLAFLVRLYGQVGSLGDLLRDPASFLRLITLPAAQQAGIMTDPFNLAAVALLLTGFALLWLHLFGLLMRANSAVAARINGLMTPLAVWTVERDPGHYAQFVMVLIGALALGTASLALTSTHDTGAYLVARAETGADVALDITTLPTSLPDAAASTPLMIYTDSSGGSITKTTLFGIEPESFLTVHPELADMLAPLMQTGDIMLPGVLLPPETQQLSISVFAASNDFPLQTLLALDVANGRGERLTLPMVADDPTQTGSFSRYVADVPTDPLLSPWRLVGLRLLSRRLEGEASFNHSIFIDDVTAISADGASTVLENFDDGDIQAWTEPANRALLSFAGITSAQRVSGQYSLRLDYAIDQVGVLMGEPLLNVNPVPPPAVPAILSSELVRIEGLSDRTRGELEIGDIRSINLTTEISPIQLSYRLLGQLDTFPTQGYRSRFIIARADWLQPILNQFAAGGTTYHLNRLWLERDERALADADRAAFEAVPEVQGAAFAWDRYGELRREPLPNAVIGILYAGFWIALILGLLDFGFYMAMSVQRRATMFAVLRAMGWNARRIWGLLTIEQITLVIPALIVGVVLGVGLSYLLLPFLTLLGQTTLNVPIPAVASLLIVAALAFGLLLSGTAILIGRMSLNQILRQE
jgi:hypothetical protein